MLNLVNTSRYAYCVIAGMGSDCSTHVTMDLVPVWHGSVWSTHVEIYFVLSQACEVFAQHMLRCILWPLYRLGFVTAC